MITLTIPELSPSLNKTLRLGHWSQHHKHRRHWAMLVLVAKSEARIWAVPLLKRAKVIIERRGGRVMDQDNLVGGAKAIVDSLKDCGFIVDDKPKNVELDVRQYPGGKDATKQTIIRIEAVS